jgi:uncharacterized protein (UPF0276 family)
MAALSRDPGTDTPHGVGVGLRRAHFTAFAASERSVPWCEIIPEAFLGFGGLSLRTLHLARARGPVIPHGVSLNLGGADPLDLQRLDALARLCDELRAPWYSDHVCASAIDGAQSFDLIPLPFCEEAAEHVAKRAREARRVLGRPIVLENITWYAQMPDSTWDEATFLRAVLDESDAGLLLDVANVVVNARNHGRDPHEMLAALPLERTVQIHLAGHRHDQRWNMVVDDHASAVSQQTLAVYANALRRIGRPVPTLLEWDQQLPSWDQLLDEVARISAFASSVEVPP